MPFARCASIRLLAALLACAMAGCGRKPAERVEWTAMGTVASFLCRDSAELDRSRDVMGVFSDVETLLNAHNPDSELSRLAALSDEEVIAKCDEKVRPCYEAAFKLMRESEGAFNPRWRGRGTLDLGGIAKGFALDLAAEKIGAAEALLDLGGNLKSCGGEWNIAVYGAAGERLVLAAGNACATSAEYARGKHIYDARTGLAVTNGVYSVTVVHPSSAMLADGLSTVLFIFGPEKGEAFLKSHYPEARAVWQLSADYGIIHNQRLNIHKGDNTNGNKSS